MTLTAVAFTDALMDLRSDEEREKLRRYFRTGEGEYAAHDVFLGVRMGDVFKLSAASDAMPLDEIEALLESAWHECRVGALRIMARRARHRKTPDDGRKALFDLYLRRHDRIDNWDLVDLAAGPVIGGWLLDRPRDVLYDLARSGNVWERRTAVYATSAFIKRGDLDDLYTLAGVLMGDSHDLIHKAVGGWLRESGKHDEDRLVRFVEEHRLDMPRTMLRTAIERFPKDRRDAWLGR